MFGTYLYITKSWLKKLYSDIRIYREQWFSTFHGIGVARGGQRGHAPPKCLENIVILCFERRFSKQNGVIRLNSNILSPLIFLPPSKFLGWLRHCFMVCGVLTKTLNTCDPCSSTGFCNITAELFSKGLCWWPPENRSVAPNWGQGPRLRNPDLEIQLCFCLRRLLFLSNYLLFWIIFSIMFESSQ